MDIKDGMYVSGHIECDTIHHVFRLERGKIITNNSVYLLKDNHLKLKPVNIILFQDDSVIVKGIDQDHCIVKQYKQYFYDDKGKQYLDCVNNISHVGHSHPKVHEAMVKQNLKFNTNTRYLYNIINEYSEKLLNKFPKQLDTIFKTIKVNYIFIILFFYFIFC